MENRPGLDNSNENNCVMNSLVQALYSSRQFREMILNFPYDDVHLESHGTQGCTLCSLRDIFKQLELNIKGVSAEDLKSALEKRFETLDENVFHSIEGADTDVVLGHVFLALHEAASGAHPQTDDGSCQDQFCPVHRLLSVRLETRRMCDDCEEKRTTIQSLNYSHVEISGQDIEALGENRCRFFNLIRRIPTPDEMQPQDFLVSRLGTPSLKSRPQNFSRGTIENRPGLDNSNMNNCVTNSIVQALYTSRQFREMVLNFPYDDVHLESHGFQGCTLCSLRDIFQQLELNNNDVSAEDLRSVLEKRFKSGTKNVFSCINGVDYTAVLRYLFLALHEASIGAHTQTNEGAHTQTDDRSCEDQFCPVHRLLSVRVETRRMCDDCKVEQTTIRNLKYSHVDILGEDIEVLGGNCCIFFNLISMPLEMQPEDFRCGYCDSRADSYALLTTQDLLVVKVHWLSSSTLEEKIRGIESVPAVLTLVAAYELLCDPDTQYSLFSMCCGDSQHEVCFATSNGVWTLYDDEDVQAIGSLDEVISRCKDWYPGDMLLPCILFFQKC